MIKVKQFVKEMIEIQNKKERELNRRGKRSNELLQKSDEVRNEEQWEAYQSCIKHQQEKMMQLIHELLVIKNILETVIEHRGDQT